MTSEPKWVVSKYAPETGERFKVLEELANVYIVKLDDTWQRVIKREYTPCPPPGRWEKVPIDRTSSIAMFLEREGWTADDERFRIIDGALVLERRVK